MPDLKALNKPARTLKHSTVGRDHVARLNTHSLAEF